jgi:hypothetical protein
MAEQSDLLAEVENPRQLEGLPHRRLFSNSQFDLIVYDQAGELAGFELSYNQGGHGISFAWMKTLGTDESGIDRGELDPIGDKRPVMRKDLAGLFKEAAVELPEPVSKLVHMNLQNAEFNDAEWEFIQSLTDDERAEIRRRAEALKEKYSGEVLEETIFIRGQCHWLEVAGKVDVLCSDAHHAAQQQWNAEQSGGFRYVGST